MDEDDDDFDLSTPIFQPTPKKQKITKSDAISKTAKKTKTTISLPIHITIPILISKYSDLIPFLFVIHSTSTITLPRDIKDDRKSNTSSLENDCSRFPMKMYGFSVILTTCSLFHAKSSKAKESKKSPKHTQTKIVIKKEFPNQSSPLSQPVTQLGLSSTPSKRKFDLSLKSIIASSQRSKPEESTTKDIGVEKPIHSSQAPKSAIVPDVIDLSMDDQSEEEEVQEKATTDKENKRTEENKEEQHTPPKGVEKIPKSSSQEEMEDSLLTFWLSRPQTRITQSFL